MDIRNFLESVLEKAQEKGIECLEIYVENKRNTNIYVNGGKVNNYSICDESGLSLRGMIKNRIGYVYTERIDEELVDMLVQQIIDNAEIADCNHKEYFFEGAKAYTRVDNCDANIDSIPNNKKINLLKQLEEEIMKKDSRVKSVNSCIYSEEKYRRSLLNTYGLDLEDESDIACLYVSIFLQDNNMVRTATDYIVSRRFKSFNVKKLADEVVSSGLEMLYAESIESGIYPVIIKNIVMANLLERYIPIFSAESVINGVSLLKEKLNQKISDSRVTIIDDPQVKNGINCIFFDAEGVPTRARKVVDNGILNTYLHNIRTSNIFGVEPTGNAHRTNYKAPIDILYTNMYIDNGEINLEEIIGGMKKGIIVTNIQGLNSGVNLISGDFSLSAQGLLIINGKIVKAVDRIVISENFYNILNNISEIGNDLRFNLKSIGAPSIAFKEMLISGK